MGGLSVVVGVVVGKSLEVLARLSATLGNSLGEAIEPLAVTLDFAGKLAAGNIEQAYGLTSEAFQRRQDLTEFSAVVAAHPGLRCALQEFRSVQPQIADELTFEIRTESADERVPFAFQLRLTREQGNWKVDELVLP